MKESIKVFLHRLSNSPRKFPVEAVMGLAFFVISALYTYYTDKADVEKLMSNGINEDILYFFVPLIILTYSLHKINRWAYIASGFLFLPLMSLNLSPFIWTYGFFFTYVLATILLLFGIFWMNNKHFASHVIHVLSQLCLGLIVSGLLTLAVFAIVGSFIYIFAIDVNTYIYTYITEFIWFGVTPQICFTLISNKEYDLHEPNKAIRLILNFILSPAVIIYTIILYAYFIKIAIRWDLPKGGVAWMVMAFISVTMLGRLVQYILSTRYYDWFYRYFSIIAIPPLIMFWVGFIYRIRLYSFTESRFYLLLAGILMTLFVLMLIWRPFRRFQIMTLILAATICVFTYIPNISAKTIGLNCQKARLENLMTTLQLKDPKSGKFVQNLDLKEINKDSVKCMQYTEVTDIVTYVSENMSSKDFKAQYGEWKWSAGDFTCTPDFSETKYYYLNTPVNLGRYNILLSDGYTMQNKDCIVKIERNDELVLIYDVKDRLKKHPELMKNPSSLLVWSNDSLMVVLKDMEFVDNELESVSYEFMLFKKSR